jgi:2,3-bisphosphoglycerate-dependent phosphoglycerate mutase
MSVSVRVGSTSYLIGSDEFFHAFFSTIAIRAEEGEWGSKYPAIMRELYGGRLRADRAPDALRELSAIAEAFGSQGPSSVVWDATDRSKTPPWRDDISASITSLKDYFWTSDGHDLMLVLEQALQEAVRNSADTVIE